MAKPITSKWKDKCLGVLKTIEDSKMSADVGSSSELLKEKEVVEKQLVSQKEEIKQIQKQIDDLDTDCEIKDINKYRMQLYHLITNIHWDLDSPPNEVKGFISKPFNVFQLDTETHSRYFISNYLWKLIDEDEIPAMKDLRLEQK